MNSLLLETWHYRDTAGNSYWAGEMKLNGGILASMPKTYGYGGQHLHDSHRLLITLGVLGEDSKRLPLDRALREAGIIPYIVEHKEAKAKDLRAFGENGKIVTYPLWVKAVFDPNSKCCDAPIFWELPEDGELFNQIPKCEICGKIQEGWN